METKEFKIENTAPERTDIQIGDSVMLKPKSVIMTVEDIVDDRCHVIYYNYDKCTFIRESFKLINLKLVLSNLIEVDTINAIKARFYKALDLNTAIITALHTKSRSKHLTVMRHFLAYILRKKGHPLMSIANTLDRDHSTIIYSIRLVDGLIQNGFKTHPEFKNIYELTREV